MPIKGLGKLAADLDPERLAEKILRVVERDYGDEIIGAVLGSAKAGIGPKDAPYPPLSKQYADQFKGGRKNFLTVTDTLLSTDRFSLTAGGHTLTLAWSGDAELGLIATVHNDGLPIGRGGPRKQREFVHFESSATWAVLTQALERAFDKVAAEFNRG